MDNSNIIKELIKEPDFYHRVAHYWIKKNDISKSIQFLKASVMNHYFLT